MSSELGETAEAARELIVEEMQEKTETAEWVRKVALSAIVMALISAIGALLAGITANESLMERTEEILEVSRLESDRLHVEVLRSKHDVLRALGHANRVKFI
jgi:hypothetical protein